MFFFKQIYSTTYVRKGLKARFVLYPAPLAWHEMRESNRGCCEFRRCWLTRGGAAFSTLVIYVSSVPCLRLRTRDTLHVVLNRNVRNMEQAFAPLLIQTFTYI